jgi:hypothetical protein
MATFVESNPGLKSRFAKTIDFPDYSTDDLVEIFVRIGDEQRYVPTTDALACVRRYLEAQTRDATFGNARLTRTLFEAAVARHASRVVAIENPTPEVLSQLLPEDIPASDQGLAVSQ